MKTFFRSVAMLLGLGLLPVAAHAQKKVIIEDEEPNSVMFVSTDKAGDEIIRIMNETRLPHWVSADMYGQPPNMTSGEL